MNWLDKVWEGTTVYEEPICFTEEADGSISGGKLLYHDVTQIMRVTSWDGKIEYEAGLDYCCTDGRIIRREGSRMPVLARSVYCIPYDGEPSTAWFCLPGKAERLTPVNDVYKYQLRVTYEHSDAWDDFIPADQSAALPRIKALLAGKKDTRIVFFGDSITAGWEASGMNEIVINMQTLEENHVVHMNPPLMPAWATLVTNALREKYPDTPIVKVNRGSGGATVGWGATNAEKLVNPHQPDFMPLAFGMNGMKEDPSVYRARTEAIIRKVRKECPECEVLLVSPMTANTEMACFRNHTVIEQEQMLHAIAETMPGVAVAPVNEIFRTLEKRGKTYWELSGNCINHPNDFSIRIYAQALLAAMGE